MGKQFDAVVIGSGISGLTCGAFLARAGMKVCVLEKHSKIGGYAHSFKRGIYRFESGVHSVPLAPDGFIFHLLRLLGVESTIKADAHQTMYNFTYGKESYGMPGRLEDIIAKLTSDFPGQAKNIKALIDDMRYLYEKLIVPLFHFEERFTERDRKVIAAYFNISYKSYIERFISDPKLANILVSQWPFWGATPERSSTIFCALAFYVHGLEGSHHILGGFYRLADAFASAITARGGEIRTCAEATGFKIENRIIRSVYTASGEEIEAKIFVSNINPYVIHNKIVPLEWRNKIWQIRLTRLRPSVSAFALYCGLKYPLDLPGGNAIYFTFAHTDFPGIFQSFENIGSKDPEHLIFLQTIQPGEPPNLMIMTFCRGESGGGWKNLKRQLTEKVILAGEKYIPGLRDSIDIIETATPATFEKFSANTAGALYGFENTKDVYGEAKLPITTYIRNLFQTGHWCKPGGGIWNVAECGYTAANIILRRC